MKQLIFVICLFPAIIHGQGLQLPVNSSGKIVFDSTLNIQEVNAPELYHRAKTFIAREFASCKTLKDDTDAVPYQLTIQARIPSVVVSMITPDSYTTFIMAFQINNHGYRYNIYDFDFNMITVTDTLFTKPMESKEVKIMSRKKWAEAHTLLASQIKSMTDRLHDYMAGRKK